MFKNRKWMQVGVGLVMAGMLGACAGPGGGGASSPEQTVKGFYDWYSKYEGSVLGAQAYRDCDYLSSGFVRDIDALVASFDKSGGGYDPFICAQDRAPEITVMEVEETGDTARVTVQAWNPIYVDVAETNGEWEITDIHCTPPQAAVK